MEEAMKQTSIRKDEAMNVKLEDEDELQMRSWKTWLRRWIRKIWLIYGMAAASWKSYSDKQK